MREASVSRRSVRSSKVKAGLLELEPSGPGESHVFKDVIGRASRFGLDTQHGTKAVLLDYLFSDK